MPSKSSGLTSLEASELLIKHGRNELTENKESKLIIFLKLFVQPMPIMIWIAVIVEAAIQNWSDFGILLGIQIINASIAFYEIVKVNCVMT